MKLLLLIALSKQPKIPSCQSNQWRSLPLTYVLSHRLSCKNSNVTVSPITVPPLSASGR